MKDIDLKIWMVRWFIWTAIIVSVIVAAVGLFFGSVIEETLFGEIAKYVSVDIALIGIVCVFGVVLGQIAYHSRKKKNDR